MLKRKASAYGQPATATRSSGNRKWLIFGSIFFPLCSAFLTWQYAPLLVRDFGVAGNLTAAKRFHVIDARCRSRLVVFYFCEVKAGEFSGNVTHETKLEYMLFALPLAKHSVRLLEQQSDPSLLTTGLGQENLWNRAIMLATICVIGFSLPIILLRRSKRRRLEVKPA
jgi:hypothetical protein